jgi:hypothetical protein
MRHFAEALPKVSFDHGMGGLDVVRMGAAFRIHEIPPMIHRQMLCNKFACRAVSFPSISVQLCMSIHFFFDERDDCLSLPIWNKTTEDAFGDSSVLAVLSWFPFHFADCEVPAGSIVVRPFASGILALAKGNFVDLQLGTRFNLIAVSKMTIRARSINHLNCVLNSFRVHTGCVSDKLEFTAEKV